MDFHSDYTMTIGGEAVRGGATIDVVNPATGQTFATAPDCSRDQLDSAVAAARAAFKTWRKVPIEVLANTVPRPFFTLAMAAASPQPILRNTDRAHKDCSAGTEKSATPSFAT